MKNNVGAGAPATPPGHRRWRRLAGPLLVAIFVVCGCDKEEFPDPGPPQQAEEIGQAKVWVTTGDESRLLAQEADISITATTASDFPVITIDPASKLQEMEGFGAALTGSSAYLINKKMTSAQRTSLLQDLFDPVKGIGISYLRMTIGASDFSLSDYTYNDLAAGETDYDLSQFSIDMEREDIIPVFHQVLAIAPDMKIMGTPWSAPAWMKTSGSLQGGELKPEAYGVYADYFVKYVRAFQAEGITVNAVTPQNEPLHFTADYPCMEMQAADQLDFVKNHLGPAFAAERLETRIIIYDHNWDNPAYPISILNDPEARQYVSGSAFHAYGGNVSAMSVVHEAHPDKGIYFTEISGGRWATDFGDNLQWNMANIFIGGAKNWSRTALLWNLALDENDGPKNNGCQDCRGVVTIQSATGAVSKNVEYYAIGHFSKLVRPGAFRIQSASADAALDRQHVAFINTDGSKVLVVSNPRDTAMAFAVAWEGAQFTYSIRPDAVATIVWK